MVKVLLVRHGRSTSNAAGTLAGLAPGIDLDDVGRDQARVLGEALRGHTVAACYRSPMERCEQTATLLGFPEAVVDERLTECDYGEWTGRPLSELSGEPLWATIQDRPSSVTFPAGEAMQAMRDRMVAFMDDLQTRHGDGELVVLVSHGDPIKAVVSEILGQPFDLFQRIVVGPASVTLVERSAAASILWFLNGGPEALRHLGSGAPVVGGGDVTGGS